MQYAVNSIPIHYTVFSILHTVYSIQYTVYTIKDWQSHPPPTEPRLLPATEWNVTLTLHCTELHWIALHYTALYCTGLQCTALHCTTVYCIALHCTVLYCTALHCIKLYFLMGTVYWTALELNEAYCIVMHCLNHSAVHRTTLYHLKIGFTHDASTEFSDLSDVNTGCDWAMEMWVQFIYEKIPCWINKCSRSDIL